MKPRRETPIRAARRLPAWLAFALAFALLSAQGFGSWHRALHGSGAESSLHVAKAGEGHAAGSVECRLIDHLFHAERLPSAAPLLALLSLSPATPSTPAVIARAAQPPRHYQARAPPLS